MTSWIKCAKCQERLSRADMRMPISGIYKIKGVDDVLAGLAEQVIFLSSTLLPTLALATCSESKCITSVLSWLSQVTMFA